MRSLLCLALLAGLAASAAAQDFPGTARPVAAADLQQRLADKVFEAKAANGATWRIEYKSNGYFIFSTSTSYQDSGKWKTEDGHLCYEPRKTKAGCNEARVTDTSVLVKRDNGEILEYVQRQ